MNRYKKRQCAHNIKKYKQGYPRVKKSKFTYGKETESIENVNVTRVPAKISKDEKITENLLITLIHLNFIDRLDHYFTMHMKYSTIGELSEVREFITSTYIIGMDGKVYDYSTPTAK